MPTGHPKMDRAILASGLLTDLIKLRAATKLRGIARKVPKVVAISQKHSFDNLFPGIVCCLGKMRATYILTQSGTNILNIITRSFGQGEIKDKMPICVCLY